MTENTATAGWRVRFVECCGRDCNEAARQFMTQLYHWWRDLGAVRTATCSSITSSAMEPFWRHLDAEFSRGLKLGAADKACQSCADTHSCTTGKKD